eukprot:1446574-Heterocapsa_arctica.AAC.1
MDLKISIQGRGLSRAPGLKPGIPLAPRVVPGPQGSERNISNGHDKRKRAAGPRPSAAARTGR